MLTTLRIRNLALVTDLTLELSPGYNAITGETGAGKSILIGALNLVLGERADRTLIRSGCDSCTVEAVFDVRRLRAPLAPFLETHGLEACADDQLLLKRTFTAQGANRQFVNGSPTPLATLAALGEWLVDLHGPHDHQSLLHPGRQLALLDAFGALETLRDRFAETLRRRDGRALQKAALIVDEQTYTQRLDLLRFQVNEITAARLGADEEAQVEREHRRASQAARLLELSQTALRQLSDDDASVDAQLAALGRTLQELHRLDPDAAGLPALQEQATAALQELHRDLSRFADRLDLDPDRLHELEERLNLIHTLKRKYGPTLEAVLASGERARAELHALEQRDAELERLNAELERTETELRQVGTELSDQRRRLIPRLRKAATRELADLGFGRCHFDIALTSALPPSSGPSSPGRSGFDTVEFQFAPNPGEAPRPLRAIASSGELARVMLALKTVLAAQDDIPVLIFDEVDANVGGETARVVGQKMRRLGEGRQVLCITHLAPVAAAASAHHVVSKDTRDGRTLTEVRRLEGRERVTELARMLGGQTPAALRHAEELLGT